MTETEKTARELTVWNPDVEREWHRLYAIHDDGDRDEMLAMAIVELLTLRRILGRTPMEFPRRPRREPRYLGVPTYSSLVVGPKP